MYSKLITLIYKSLPFSQKKKKKKKELKRNNPTFTTYNLKVCYDLCIAEELLKIPVDILLKNMLRP